jgi:hypothetical protein
MNFERINRLPASSQHSQGHDRCEAGAVADQAAAGFTAVTAG